MSSGPLLLTASENDAHDRADQKVAWPAVPPAGILLGVRDVELYGAEGWREALRFLNDFAASTRADAQMFLPGVRGVQVINRGQGGWVRLVFYGYVAADATDLARRLLLPDPEPVDPRDADFAFEGVPGIEPADGAGVAARLRPSPGPPILAAHRDLPGGTEADDLGYRGARG